MRAARLGSRVSEAWIKEACVMFFFSSRRRHTRLQGDWSSDVCSSDLQSKQMLLVDLGPEGLQAVTPLPVPCFQPMASVAGSLTALPDLMRAAAQAGSPARSVWLEVVVEQDDYLPQLTDRVQALADELPVELLRVRRQRRRAVAGMAAAAGESLHEISPADVFERRLALETLEPGLAQAQIGRASCRERV